MMNKILLLVGVLLLVALQSQAQTGSLEEYFFESGKIKVVIAVALAIGLGLFIYLFRLDRKVSELEKRTK